MKGSICRIQLSSLLLCDQAMIEVESLPLQCICPLRKSRTCAYMRQIIVSYYKAMQGHPIHLWDALSGELRASYRVYNAADEVTAACSIAFDAQGQRLFAGLNNRLCIFDVARPGRYCKNIVPHSRASPGLQGNLLTLLSFNSLLSFFPCYDAPVSFVQVHTKWKPAFVKLFVCFFFV